MMQAGRVYERMTNEIVKQYCCLDGVKMGLMMHGVFGEFTPEELEKPIDYDIEEGGTISPDEAWSRYTNTMNERGKKKGYKSCGRCRFIHNDGRQCTLRRYNFKQLYVSCLRFCKWKK